MISGPPVLPPEVADRPDTALTLKNLVNSFSTRRLSTCTDEYALTYNIFTVHLLSKQ